MSETSTVFVKSVELREGVSQTGKPWKRVVLTDGNGKVASSFDLSLFDKAKAFEGSDAEIFTQPNGNFTDLIDIRPEQNGKPVEAGAAPTSETPATEVRRNFAETAWLCAARMAGADLGFDAAQHIADKIFFDLLKKGKAVEDEDIPF